MLLRTILFIIILLPTIEVNGQKIVRWVIGSSGSSKTEQGILQQATSGQAAPVSSLNESNSVGLSQGFHRSNRTLKFDNGIEIILYPNPNSGQFQFFTDLSNDVSFEFQIIDITGRILQNHSGKGKETISVDISQHASGSYILRITTPQRTANIKFEKTP